MKIKKIILTAGAVTPLAFAGVVHAATIPSDYAQDVTAGHNQISSDQSVKTQANEVKDGEHVEGQVDDGQVEVNETVGSQENEMEDSEGGEASHGEASTDASSSERGGSTTETNGGTNQ
jgi:hypothetical protein